MKTYKKSQIPGGDNITMIIILLAVLVIVLIIILQSKGVMHTYLNAIFS